MNKEVKPCNEYSNDKDSYYKSKSNYGTVRKLSVDDEEIIRVSILFERITNDLFSKNRQRSVL